MSNLTKEKINTMFSSYKKKHISSARSGDDTFILVGEPTVANGVGHAFLLNEPPKLVKLKLVHEYVDNFKFNFTSTEDEVKVVAELMEKRASNFMKLNKDLVFLDYGFDMPSWENEFCRNDASLEYDFVIYYYISAYKEV